MHDEEFMITTIQDDDDVSDQHVWSAIRYLDPDRKRRESDCPLIVAVIVVSIIWGMFWVLLHSL